MELGITSTSNEIATLPVKARHLWSSLSVMHADLNALTRQSPMLELTTIQLKLLKKCFREVDALLEPHIEMVDIIIPHIAEPQTVADALILVGQYRAVLKTYRIEKLGEDPYSITM